MTAPPPSAALTRDPGYPRLKQQIMEHTGLTYFADKDDALTERLQRRLTARGGIDCDAYFQLLGAEAFRGAEMDKLAEQLTIGETFFFRYTEQFHALRDRVVPDAIARNAATRRLKIWSAGSSTGAEAYSVAAVVRQALGGRLADWRVSIVGTDINQSFLAHARRGIFNDWALRDVAPAERDAVVERVEAGWQVLPALREMVTFGHQNLMSLAARPTATDSLQNVDIVLCRNVLIYFDAPTIAALMPKLAARMVEHGWLLVGHAEAGDAIARVFETFFVPGATLYRRRPAESEVPRPVVAPVLQAPRPERPASRVDRSAAGRSAAARSPSRAVAAERRDPVMVTPADGDERQAEMRCRRDIAAAPSNAFGHYHLALFLDHRDESTAAEQALRRAIYLDRGFAMAHFHLGALLRRRGDLSGARKSFYNALHGLAHLADEQTVPASEIDAGELRLVLAGQLRSVLEK